MLRWVRVSGRESMGCEKLLPRVRWVREGGRESMGALKVSEKVRWVRGGAGRECKEVMETRSGGMVVIVCPCGILIFVEGENIRMQI
jgi:hypothetical protein